LSRALASLALAFVYRGDSSLDVSSRLAIPLILLAYLLSTFVVPVDQWRLFLLVSTVLVITALALLSIGGLKRSLFALLFVSVFVVLGIAFSVLASYLGFVTQSALNIALASYRGATILLVVSLTTQWLSVEELVWILHKLIRSRSAAFIALALTQFPLVLVIYAEALFTMWSKQGRRGLYKAVVPLVTSIINYSYELSEAVYIYGIPIPRLRTSPKLIDLAVILASASLPLLPYLLF